MTREEMTALINNEVAKLAARVEDLSKRNDAATHKRAKLDSGSRFNGNRAPRCLTRCNCEPR
jgi:hypothetical protein